MSKLIFRIYSRKHYRMAYCRVLEHHIWCKILPGQQAEQENLLEPAAALRTGDRTAPLPDTQPRRKNTYSRVGL